MSSNLSHRNRKTIRLRNYDYSKPGAYFVTMCVLDRTCIFGEIKNNKMHLNEFGEILNSTWNDLPNHIENIVLDEFIIMPNHVHGIIIIQETKEPADSGTKNDYTLSEIIRQLKTLSARRINQARKTPGISIWQRSFFDHIGRDESDLYLTRQYIQNNPLNWDSDDENPEGKSPKFVRMLNPQIRNILTVPD